MSLLKTSVLNGVAVGLRIAGSLVTNKILAIFVGPSGYAVIGQFQNAISLLTALAGGLIATGVTKITAERFDDEAAQSLVWKTAIRCSLYATLVASVILIVLHGVLGEELLHRPDMGGVFVWLALSLPAMASNSLLLAILNGRKQVERYVLANIMASAGNVVITGLASSTFGLYGALTAYAINPAVGAVFTVWIVRKLDWFRRENLWGAIDRSAVRQLSGYGLMGLTSAIVGPLSYIFVRSYLVDQFGLTEAGYWQAVWKISEIYLMLITTTLSVYYLPRLAEIRTSRELVKEVRKVYVFALPVVVIGALSIYLLQNLIIRILFSSDFLEMGKFFAWQLSGDVLKIGSWVMSYIMVGRALFRSFLITEIGSAICFVVLTKFFVDSFGVVGVSMAYAASYALYWIAVAVVFKITLREQQSADPVG